VPLSQILRATHWVSLLSLLTGHSADLSILLAPLFFSLFFPSTPPGCPIPSLDGSDDPLWC